MIRRLADRGRQEKEMIQLKIRRPDDFHLHLRDGREMEDVLAHSARVFQRAMIMPNLRDPVVNLARARAYRKRIFEALPDGLSFEPLMSLYLRDQTTVGEIREAASSGIVAAAKLYPAGATTNSESGVTDILAMADVFEEMEARKMPLMVHAEVMDPEVDIFDRERVFVEQILGPLVQRHAGLKVVLEHASTAGAIDFVRSSREGVAASITVHHLLLSRNDIFKGGINPHHYCLPIVKKERDRLALVEAATSGDRRFFAGTDSAPHSRCAKERPGGSAGIFSAPVAVSLYAEIFERSGALDKLDDFLSLHGAEFYALSPNQGELILKKERCRVPDCLPFGGGEIVPLWAGRKLQWSVMG